MPPHEAPESEHSAANPFEVAWREVVARWDDDTAHRKFIALCAAQAALHEAGRRYRNVRDTDPQRRAAAEKQIDAVLAAALAHMKASKTERPARPRRLTWLAFGLSAFFLIYALMSVLRARPH